MEIKHFGLIGLGGFAREVMPFIQDFLFKTFSQKNTKLKIYFVDIDSSITFCNGYPVISEQEFKKLEGEKYFNIAISDSKIREKIANRLIHYSNPLSLFASNCLAYESSVISKGGILCPFSIITSNTKIGKFFHANLYSYVAHDCFIGDYVTFAPSVKCNGNVHIYDHAYIGTGAIIRNGTSDEPIEIGEGAVIGMGAVVTKSVPPFSVVIGNPAREMKGKNHLT
ncbi:hypothetical protein [Leptospira interrogans]|uniref:PglD-related sugar-binding protein n=1 Tax=Leptospira interrogans TaxID=173 RepID=UPI0002BA2A11|nr:hypothetical protein [Leptospira interrogans]EMN47123.1 sugar O-acyltransferase, sialic acid O-acetyltransferase NeuD family [Leptospira interrogans str. L1207]